MMITKFQEKATVEEKLPFRVRNPERDLLNDDERIERLDGLLEDVLSEVRFERKGLRQRYENSLDNEIRPLDMHAWNIQNSHIITESEVALAHCVTRLKKLESQENILVQIQQDLARLQGMSVE